MILFADTNVPILPVIFFLQMFVILAACRLCGWLVRRWLHQPQVIGEMIAGVVLGPSLLGLLWRRGCSRSCFRRNRSRCSTSWRRLGIALYMFLVGLISAATTCAPNAPSAVAVSVAGIAVPFIVAIAGTPWLHGSSRPVLAGRLAASTPRCSSARPSPSRPSPCSRASSTSAASRDAARPRCALSAAAHRRRHRLVRGRGGAREPRRGCRRRGAGDRRRHRAWPPCSILLGPRLFAPLGRLAEREHAARPAAEPDGARGRR